MRQAGDGASMSLAEARAARRAAMDGEQAAEYQKAYDDAGLAHELARMVYELRTSAGLTQNELARRMGTHQSVIARLENSGGTPSITTLDRLARAVGMHLQIDVAAGTGAPEVRPARVPTLRRARRTPSRRARTPSVAGSRRARSAAAAADA